MKKVLNDLYDYPNMKIYQFEEAFKFSLDSILLSELVTVHKKDKLLLDLCTGNAVIPLVLSTRTNISMVGVELQKEIYDLGLESVLYNGKEKQIQLLQENISQIKNYFPGNNFDIVTCNPPYFKFHHRNFINRTELKQIARHEVATNLEEVVHIASDMIKDKGNFYMVHIPDRLQEIFLSLEKYQFRMKDLYFVYPKRGEKAFLILFRAMKYGNIGLKVHEAIYLNEVTTYQGIFKDVI